MIGDYNLSLIRQRAKEKNRRIMNLIDSLEDNVNTGDYIKELEQSLGAELCSSIQASEDLCELQNEHPFYQYKDGGCSFMVDDVEFEVADLRSMRQAPRLSCESYFDMCVLVCSYKDADGIYTMNVVPDCWLFGSTSDEFNEYKPVHSEFIAAAKKYIEQHNITPDMQKE